MLQDPIKVDHEYRFKRYLSDRLLNDAAEESGLNCGPGWDERTSRYVEMKVAMLASVHPLANLSDDARLNRKFVETQHRAATGKIDGFKIDAAYLRTGALSIGENGETITAPDAAQRLEEFCTLYAETKEQSAFVAKLAELTAAAVSLEKTYKDFCDLAPTKAGREALRRNLWRYDHGRFDLTDAHGTCGTALHYADDKDAAARALITFFGLSGKTDTAPKFYNLANVPAYGLADLYTITGGLIGEKDAPKAEEDAAPKRRTYLAEFYPRIVTD